ncbi:MAG: hypothetical protein RLN70_13275, partial [Rhodospirillaceae bacterium]
EQRFKRRHVGAGGDRHDLRARLGWWCGGVCPMRHAILALFWRGHGEAAALWSDSILAWSGKWVNRK